MFTVDFNSLPTFQFIHNNFFSSAGILRLTASRRPKIFLPTDVDGSAEPLVGWTPSLTPKHRSPNGPVQPGPW